MGLTAICCCVTLDKRIKLSALVFSSVRYNAYILALIFVLMGESEQTFGFKDKAACLWEVILHLTPPTQKNLSCFVTTLRFNSHLIYFIGAGNGNPLQHSWLGNPMDRGAGWATVPGVPKSQT